MSFLYPAYLYGLSLISIPIIIHFFNFQRARKVYFTNVSFLKTVKEVTNARSKLKNILVLIARILFLAFLVIAFARPVIIKENNSVLAEGNYVSIYLDNSYSMQNEQDNRRLFDIALRQAEEITTIFPKNTLYQLVTNSTSDSYQFFYNADKLKEQLTEIKLGNTDLPFEQINQIQREAFRDNATGQGNHIFWLSDFQQYPQETLNANFIDTASHYYLLPIRGTNKANVYVDSVWLETPFIQLRENTLVNIKIRNESEERVNEQLVRLYVDEKQVASSTISLEPKASQTIELNFAVTESGSKPCRIALEDYPILFDNEYFFTLQVAPKITIVQVTNSEKQYLERVYGNEPFFQHQRYDINDLDYNALQSADLIILDNLNILDNALQTSLQKAMQSGASLVVFPSINSDVTSYANLLGIPFRSVSSNLNESAFIEVEVPEAENPFFTGVFEKVVSNMSMPKGVPMYAWNRVGQNLMTYKNDRAFLTRFRNNTGNIYLFSTPLDSKASSFFRHAMFVPIMYKIALSSKVSSNQLAYSFSEEIATIKVEDFTRNDIVKFELGELAFIPDQRMVGNELLITIPKNDADAGNYQMIKNRSNEAIGLIAFNHNKAESNLQYFSEEALNTLATNNPKVQLYENRDEETFVRDFQEKQFSNPLWRYALLLALLFLLAETLLVRFWKVE